MHHIYKMSGSKPVATLATLETLLAMSWEIFGHHTGGNTLGVQWVKTGDAKHPTMQRATIQKPIMPGSKHSLKCAYTLLLDLKVLLERQSAFLMKKK